MVINKFFPIIATDYSKVSCWTSGQWLNIRHEWIAYWLVVIVDYWSVGNSFTELFQAGYWTKYNELILGLIQLTGVLYFTHGSLFIKNVKLLNNLHHSLLTVLNRCALIIKIGILVKWSSVSEYIWWTVEIIQVMTFNYL